MPFSTIGMEVLGKLLGSEARVRLLRLFFLNPDTNFDNKIISQRTKTSVENARKELFLFQSVGIVKRCHFTKEFPDRNKKGTTVKKKVYGWCLDKTFPYGEQLKNLLVSTDLIKKNSIMNRFRNAGNIKLLLISGIFTRNDSSRTDIFIVGDKLKRGVIENILRTLEAEAGKELRYAVLDTAEFRYRLSVYDKFVRDVLDYPHEVIIDRIGVA